MKRLLVLSGKGGTGKTTVSAALIRLSQAKAVADCDVEAPNLHLVFPQSATPQAVDFLGGDKAEVNPLACIGCGACVAHCRFGACSFTREGLATVNPFACEGCGVCQWVCPVQGVTLAHDVAGVRNVYVGEGVFSTAKLKMGRGNSGKLVSQVKMAMVKQAPPCDLAVVDGSPGIGCPVMASLGGMDQVLLVAEPSQSGLSDLKRLVQTIQGFQIPMFVCINKWDVSPEHTAEIQRLCAQQHIPLVGQIPFDPAVVEAVNSGGTIVDVDTPASQAVRQLYKTIIQINKSV